MWQLRLRPEIQNDIELATDWWDSKRQGLGDEFLKEFYFALDTIEERPLSFAIAANGLRPCRLKRFSYIVHYRVTNDEILIIALMDSGRDDSAFIHRGITK